MNDPIEELRQLRPEPDDQWADSDRGRTVLERAIALGESGLGSAGRTLAKPPVRHRRRYYAAAVAALVAITIGALVGAGYFGNRTPRHPHSIGCYATFNENADTLIPGGRIVRQFSSDPVKVCRLSIAKLPRPNRAEFSTDNLVICINIDRGIGVFPAPPGEAAQSACPRLGDWTPEAGTIGSTPPS